MVMGIENIVVVYYECHLYYAVLGRVQSFLPQLEKADQELRVRLESQPQGDYSDLDIENVKEGEACIEMVMMIYI